MSRVRIYVVGRARDCDVQLDDASVSRRHAEVVRMSDGRLYVTDRVTTNGTFLLDGDVWRPVRQSFLEPAGRIRFGDCELTAGGLDALCLRNRPDPPDDPERQLVSRQPDGPDPRRELVRDPETGQIVERA